MMELDKTRIEDAIIREVVGDLAADHDLRERVARAVDARIDAHFRTIADAQIKAAIEDAIVKGFEREYQKVDSFGQRQGATTTIRAELEKLIAGYWNEKVDRHGKPASGYNADVTRAEWLMTQLVASDFKGAMQQHVVNLGGSLKDKLRSELHETVNRLLSEIFHVKSLGDQGADRRDRSTIDPAATS